MAASALSQVLCLMLVVGSLWSSCSGNDDWFVNKGKENYPAPSPSECSPPPVEECPPPPVYYPPPPSVDCSQCSCVSPACPICTSCPPPVECPPPPPPVECPACPDCNCPPPKCVKPPKCEKPPPPECVKCDKYPDTYTSDDASLVNGLLTMEYALNGYYKNAASSGFKDATVKKLAGDFKAQTDGHISALGGLLKEQAASQPKMNLNKEVFAAMMSEATGKKSDFDAYASGTNVLLAASAIAPLVSEVSTSSLSQLQGKASKSLMAGVASSLAGQTGGINAVLLSRSSDKISNGMTVREASGSLAAYEQRVGASSNITAAPLEVSTAQVAVSAPSAGEAQALLKKLGILT